MRLLIAALLAVAAFTLAGCDGSSPASTTTPTVDFAAEAREAVPGAVLAPDDIREFSAQDTADLQEQAELSPECDIFEPEVIFPDAEATAVSDAYEGPNNEQLLNYAAIYRTTEDASAAMTGTRDLVERCEDEFKDTVERVGKEVLDVLGIDLGPFTGIDISILEYVPPPAGEEQTGYRMNATVDLIVAKEQYNLDVIIVRQGRVVGALVYGVFGAARASEEAALLAVLTPKLEAADESLPD